MNVSFFQELLNGVAERGRHLLDRSFGSPDPMRALSELALDLLSGRGEASGVALAQQLLTKYRALTIDEKKVFFHFLADELAPDDIALKAAAEAYVTAPGNVTLEALSQAVGSPRTELFRRLNLAPGATAELVAMRAELLSLLDNAPSLASVDRDLMALFETWFNRGFLVLKRIDWTTPASILEKIIAYEAVHEIQGWEDLRRRLDPKDRRCFAFFHPSLVDDPLIFVEVALTNDIPKSIQSLLSEEHKLDEMREEPTTAVFYSISNCQEGLRGISFGSFLIKQVVEDLARELPTLKTFVTLSPVPRFRRWLATVKDTVDNPLLSDDEREKLQALGNPDWILDERQQNELQSVILPLAAHYFLVAKRADGLPIDQVSRFHLGNGARLERLNWLGDISEKGLQEAYGLMVNYLYDPREIERNHEGFANSGGVATTRAVRSLLRSVSRSMVAASPMEEWSESAGQLQNNDDVLDARQELEVDREDLGLEVERPKSGERALIDER